MTAPISSHAVLSDQRTAALVAADGTVDWLCLPRFDGEPVLGALLDADDGGAFTLRPVEPFESDRRYLPDTNVLETTFRTAAGTVRVTDALAMGDHRQPWVELIRAVEPLSGEVEMVWEARPRVGWGRGVPEAGRLGDVPALFCGGHTVVVRGWDAGEPSVRDGAVGGRFTARDGVRPLVVVEACEERPLLLDGPERVRARLEETGKAWQRWLGFNAYDGPWAGPVRRSLLALGACMHAATGAFVAAPTTSLPERIGGPRNYDYRFCWLRDTTFALDALLRSGLQIVVHASLSWLLDAARRTGPRLPVYYTIGGDPGRVQVEHDWPGYRGTRPVVTGNDAAGQLQLGGFGDLLETAWLWVRDGNGIDPASGRQLADVATHMTRMWRNPDAGIWELGDRLRGYTKSKADAWATMTRALELAERGAIPGEDAHEWARTREEVRDWIEARCWSEQLGAYARSAEDHDQLDAAVLLLSRMGYADPRGARMTATINAVRERLDAGGPLLYRFTGAEEIEGAFVACSFWLADALARAGRLEEAAEQFEAMLVFANDVGLFSEEIDPATGGQLGNTPQALSHLALVTAATSIAEASNGGRGSGQAAAGVAPPGV